MKRSLGVLFLVLALFSITLSCSAGINFDISVFKNNPKYTVEFDDMDDTGEISLLEGGSFFGSNQDGDKGIIMATLSLKIIDAFPPALKLKIIYYGEDWVFTDKVIIKPDSTRYTFEVNRNTDVRDGMILEVYTVVLTDESIGLLKDIVDANISNVQYRLDGDRNVDGQLEVDVANIKQFYDDYLASGALNNDFSDLKTIFPCAIKNIP